MATRLTPVEGDPFARPAPKLTPVAGDPFVEKRSFTDHLKAILFGDPEADRRMAATLAPLQEQANAIRDRDAAATREDIAHSDGLLDRAGDFIQRGAQQVGSGLSAFTGALGDIELPRLPWVSQEAHDAGRALARMQQDSMRATARTRQATSATPIEHEVTWNKVKAHPNAANIGNFILEQGAQSLPGMGTALLSLPAYAASNTGNIAQQRAANDGREDATIGDVGIAAPAGIASAALERLGIEKIVAPGAGNLIARIGKAALGEGLTEGAQTGVEYTGGNAGTNAGFNLGDMGDQMLSAFVAGAGLGGPAHAAVDVGGHGARVAADAATGLPTLMSAMALEAPVPGVPTPSLEPQPVRELAPRQVAPKLTPVKGDPFLSAEPSVPEPQPADPQPAISMEPPLGRTDGGLGQPVAPEPIAAATVREPEALQGGEKYVRTPAGNKVRTRMEVVDASTLNKAEGAFQNRDRSRDTTALQVQDIIGKFDPELLGDDPSSDRGAPIVGQDHTVLSGNGRMLALNQIYDQYPRHAFAYRTFINDKGFSTEGIDRPVLIRRVAQDMTPEEARQFVIESNKDNKLELSPVERARSDADAVTPDMLSKYAGGDLNSGANAPFVASFTKSLTAGELGNVIGSDRRLTTAGVERIENAVVAKAYDHPKLLEKLMESAHNEIRAITSSLAHVAPAWAAMRAASKTGEIEGRYDITDDLADAAMRVSEARKRGTKPADILTQIDAFNRPSPAAEALVEAFYSPGMKRAASVKSVTEFLRDYVDTASAQEAGDGLFGAEPGKDPVDILKELLRQRDEPNGSGMFDALENKENDNAHLPNSSGSADDPGARRPHERQRRADDAAASADADGPLQGAEGRDRLDARQRSAAASGPRGHEGGDPSLEERPPSARSGDDGGSLRATPERVARHAAEAPQQGRSDQDASGRTGERTGASSRAGDGRDASGIRGRSNELLNEATPADTSEGGAYQRTHAAGAKTDRASDLRSAVEHLGLAWDDFNLKAPPTQMQLLQRAIRSKLGIAVAVDHSEKGAHRNAVPYRVAIDQMLDAFHNITGMAAVLGLPEKAMSLNGTLSLELRKKARFYGAFYPGEEKIALPGRSNSFAHEWGHALDYHLMGILSPTRAKGLSGVIRKSGVGSLATPELAERFGDLMKAIFFGKAELAAKVMELEAKAASAKSPSARQQFERQIERVKQGAGQHRTGRTDFYRKAKSFDGSESDYWQSPTEMLARSFEAFVAHKAEAAGMSTEVISHADGDYLSNADERLAATFPKGEERQAIFDAYDDLFATLSSRDTLGKGDKASIPDNPERRSEATPEQRNVFRRIVSNELGAFADWQRSREKSDQPKDRKSFAQKANDVRHFLFSGMAAEMRALGRRHNSKAIAQLHDLLVSEAGKGDRLQRRDFIMARRLRANRYANSIERALLTYGPLRAEGLKSHATVLSKDQAADVRAMMVDEAHDPAFPELKPLASRLREISDGIWHDIRAGGFNIGYARNGHLPRFYDAPKAEADMKGFLEKAGQVYEAAGLEPAEARQAAADWYFRLINGAPHNFDQHQPHGDFLKARALPPEADTLMADYMVNEPIDLMRRYAEAAAHRIEWGKRFGADGSGLTELFNHMAREGVDRRDMATIRTMLDIMAGQNPGRVKDPTMNALGAGFNTIYGTVALLGRAVFQSLAESLTSGIVLENPVYGIGAMVNLVTGAFGTASAKERRELVEMVGLVDVTNHTRLLADRFGGSYDDPASIQKINNKLFYNTGLIALTRAQYTHNIDTINAYLSHLSKKLVNAEPESKTAKEILDRFNELGIRDPLPFAKWMTEKGGGPFGLGAELPTKAELSDGLDYRDSAPWAFDWVTATRRLSERIVQDPHAMTKSRLSHAGNMGRLVTGIQAFNYSFYENVLKPVWKRNHERIAGGRYDTAAKAAAATLIGGFGTLFLGQLWATTLRVFLTDRERWREEEEKGTLSSYLLGRTMTSFIGNPLDPAVQAVKGYKYNRDPLNSFSGPALGNFASNASDVIKLGARNSRKTNSAEHNALNGAYRLMSPFVSAGVGSIPGGPIVSGIEGAAQSYLTSPQAGQDVATAIVGPKNGRVGADGKKIKSGPTAYDRMLDRRLGEVKRKPRSS